MVGFLLIRARTKINEAYSDIFVDKIKDSFTIVFEMEVEVSLLGGVSQKKWVVHHTMQQSVGPELTEWGREKKLFGWVGVAVPLQVRDTSKPVCALGG